MRIDAASAGEGIGLADAQELATALGGHLLLAEEPTTRFTLLIAKPDVDGLAVAGAVSRDRPAL